MLPHLPLELLWWTLSSLLFSRVTQGKEGSDWLSSTRTALEETPSPGPESLHPVGGKRRLAGWSVELISKPTSGSAAFTHFCGLPAKLLPYVLLGTSPEDHPDIEANAKCSP